MVRFYGDEASDHYLIQKVDEHELGFLEKEVEEIVKTLTSVWPKPSPGYLPKGTVPFGKFTIGDSPLW